MTFLTDRVRIYNTESDVLSKKWFDDLSIVCISENEFNMSSISFLVLRIHGGKDQPAQASLVVSLKNNTLHKIKKNVNQVYSYNFLLYDSFER